MAPGLTCFHSRNTCVSWPWLLTVSPGAMTPREYDQAVAGLVGYLQWMGEPAQNQRVRVGVWVMMFLLAFTVIAWRLNAAFWKDIR